jgi:hypothetical protein
MKGKALVHRRGRSGASRVACADIPEIPVRNSGIPEIIRDFLLAGLRRVILP